MEEKTFYVSIKKEDNNDFYFLDFKIEKDNYKINLNDQNASCLKPLFYKIIKLTFECNPKFELDNESATNCSTFIKELSIEYLNELNKEIIQIKNDNHNFIDEINNDSFNNESNTDENLVEDINTTEDN